MLYVFVFLYCKDTSDINTCQTDNYYTLIDKIYQTKLLFLRPNKDQTSKIQLTMALSAGCYIMDYLANTLHYSNKIHPYVSEFSYLCN